MAWDNARDLNLDNHVSSCARSRRIYTTEFHLNQVPVLVQRDFLIENIHNAEGEIDEIVVQKTWSYFPHVKTGELNAGFYEKLSSLQGNSELYFVGSLMNFETVETSAAFAKALVEKHFPKLTH